MSFNWANVVNAMKKNFCIKGEGAIDSNTVTRWFKKFQESQQLGKVK